METVEPLSSPQQILAAVTTLSSPELEQVVDQIIAIQAARKAPHLTATESALLTQINQGFSTESQARMQTLRAQQAAQDLTPAEADELTELTDRLEEWHAGRVRALAELAGCWGLTLTALMDRLGIQFPDYD